MKLMDAPLTLLLLGSLPFAFACATGGAKPPAETPTPKSAAKTTGPTGATPPAAGFRSTTPERDPHSFAHPDEVAVEHLQLSLSVDFEHRKLTGRAGLRIVNKTGADSLYLDTRDLDVQKVTIGEDGRVQTQFALGDAVPYLGRPLQIHLPKGATWVNVEYSTRPEAAALQWLTPAQTATGKKPFLYTQSEAILARTWIPCQDTPGVRMTYDATVRVPTDLLAVMSAENPQAKNSEGLYRFRMPQRIPSYLMALAVGDLEFRALDKRSGVYSEPTVIEQAAWELADTPRMIDAAEKLYGPYRWGRYDLLVLPPSFPYGGMENPRLTFATPTILARDRSLVSLVAHELAHSWSGNLVTNATWNDFWLNEGFTDYFERRIMESLNGKDYSDMLWVLGRQGLNDEIADKGKDSPDTHLYLSLTSRDPDDGMGEIAYEKGALFLRTIEETVGRPRFDAFLRTYFDTFAFQSMDTRRFVAYLKTQLPGVAEKVQLDAWVYGPGVPANAPEIHSADFAKVEGTIAAWKQGTPAASLDTKGWATQQWQHFLRNLPTPLTVAQMSALDAAFHFTDSGNSEILNLWLLRAIPNRYSAAYPALERFLVGQGRRKFLKPLYTELAKTPDGTEMALRIYQKARPGYHSVSQGTIDKILDWRG